MIVVLRLRLRECSFRTSRTLSTKKTHIANHLINIHNICSSRHNTATSLNGEAGRERERERTWEKTRRRDIQHSSAEEKQQWEDKQTAMKGKSPYRRCSYSACFTRPGTWSGCSLLSFCWLLPSLRCGDFAYETPDTADNTVKNDTWLKKFHGRSWTHSLCFLHTTNTGLFALHGCSQHINWLIYRLLQSEFCKWSKC